jgi:nicotinamidase-related amidase
MERKNGEILMYTALLVIDVQVGIIDGPQPAYQRDQVLHHIAHLIDAARTTRTPIIYIQHESDAGSRLEPGTPGWQIHAAVEPLVGETILHKRASDSFYGTTLQDELQKSGIQKLVITGCRTEMCIDTTCRAAISRGYDVLLPTDAHTTLDSEILSAKQIIAHHNYTLDDFGTDEHVIITRPTAEITFA